MNKCFRRIGDRIENEKRRAGLDSESAWKEQRFSRCVHTDTHIYGLIFICKYDGQSGF